MTERDKVTVNDIIGLVKTDEPTNSVELKKEIYKMPERFTYDKLIVAFSKGGINDNVTGETYEFTMDTVLDLMNNLHEEKDYWKKRCLLVENKYGERPNKKGFAGNGRFG